MKKKVIIIVILIIIALSLIATVFFFVLNHKKNANPEEVFLTYMKYISNEKYEALYAMLTEESKSKISQTDFINRNKNIYSGIDMDNMQIEITNIEEINSKQTTISYNSKMESSAGEIEFENTVNLYKNKEKEYKIDWSSNLIFPNLLDTDKVKITTDTAKRGKIVDRSGLLLAGEGSVSSIGIVPGKLSENKDEDLKKIAELLDVSVEKINKLLSASYVKDDTFVAIKNISKDDVDLKNKLLEIKGIKITTSSSRVYPLGEAASLLTGYVQNITAEELEKNADKGYTSTSVIGKAGLEKQYEDRLRGKNGKEIYLVDSNGNKKQTIAKIDAEDGEDIMLTIDASMQQDLYNKLKNDIGFFVVMEPKTGELLALVSTPSYDANDFILGMSNEKWNELKNNKGNPMSNKVLQSWCPGSTFKPITGAIGLTSGKLDVNDEFEYTGLSWQKNSSWGNYNVTTLTPYSSAKNLSNATIYSDNIYFAQATLQIGKNTFEQGLKKIGFGDNLDIDLNISKSQFANDGSIDTEIALADSGYGQGEILVNPIHMAAIYSAFANDGKIVKPYIEYTPGKDIEYLVEEAFSTTAANTMRTYLTEVVENVNGTAHDMKINGITIAGKTGTAELKTSKGEKGETLGWFNCFTADENSDNQLLVISMVEDASSNGGSHYLIKMIRSLIGNAISY